ncbi:JmjC domain-containing protein [Citreimonas sp.]|uniref:JmjC domain-containing protein n=1 Tax=Citreimonas sp. TaxID=3036715 RepID=UPI0035C846FC
MTPMTERELETLLLGEGGFPDFWQTSWNRQRTWVRGRDPSVFASCVTLDEIDALISQTRLPLGNFDLAYDQQPLDKNVYCRDGLIVPARVYDLHREGVTIILRSAHFWLQGLDRLRRAAEGMFACPVQANVYLTPPDNQSTPAHWDTHDLFVLQIAGAKLWPLFANTGNPRPLVHERFRPGIDPVGAPTQTLRLESGDSLYLPRGEIHAPVSVGYSVHVALGVSSPRWIDVALQRLADTLPPDSPLRRPVSPEASGVDRAVDAAAAAQALRDLLDAPGLLPHAAAPARAIAEGAEAPQRGRLNSIVEEMGEAPATCRPTQPA